MSNGYPAVIPMLAYEDGPAAMRWLAHSVFVGGRECWARTGGSAMARWRRARG